MTNPMQAIADLAASEGATEQAYQEWARKHTTSGAITDLSDAIGRLVDAIVDAFGWHVIIGAVLIWVVMASAIWAFGW